MRSLGSILAYISPDADEERRVSLLRNALYVGSRLGASVHVFVDRRQLQELQKLECERSKALPGARQPIVFHALMSDSSRQLREAIVEYDGELLVLDMEDRPLSKSRAVAERRVFEEVPRPILLLPPRVLLEDTPIHSFLVPMSGEERESASLGFALRVAERIGAPVDLVHVTSPDKPCTCWQVLESLGDEFHHEYPELLERVVTEASPYSHPHQRRWVRNFHHTSGDAAGEIRALVKGTPGIVLVIEWKGILNRGRAKVVKDLVSERISPIIFVKEGPRRKSRLKAGPEFDAA